MKRARWLFWQVQGHFHMWRKLRAQDRGNMMGMVNAHMKVMRCVAKAYNAIHGDLP